MKSEMKCLLIGLIATGITMSSSAAQIDVNWSAEADTLIASTTSPLNYLSGDLIEVGTFAVAPTPGNPGLANFTVFGTSLTDTGVNAGTFAGAHVGSDVGFAHSQIYLVAFNNATGVGATQEGIFFVNDANNSNWKFPASSDVVNAATIDLQDMFTPADNGTLAPGATIIYGSKGTDPSGPFNVLALGVPEPSTWALAGTGLLGLLAIRRRR